MKELNQISREAGNDTSMAKKAGDMRFALGLAEEGYDHTPGIGKKVIHKKVIEPIMAWYRNIKDDTGFPAEEKAEFEMWLVAEKLRSKVPGESQEARKQILEMEPSRQSAELLARVALLDRNKYQIRRAIERLLTIDRQEYTNPAVDPRMIKLNRWEKIISGRNNVKAYTEEFFLTIKYTGMGLMAQGLLKTDFNSITY